MFHLLRKNFNFIVCHYTWILFCALLAFPVLMPYGNLEAIDVLFFGSSAATESGLNTIDLKALHTYQQVYLYIIPIITNLGFVNILVVVVRLYWFRKRIGELKASETSSNSRRVQTQDVTDPVPSDTKVTRPTVEPNELRHVQVPITTEPETERSKNITLVIPGPRQRDAGQPINALDGETVNLDDANDDDTIKPAPAPPPGGRMSGAGPSGKPLSLARSVERAAASVLVLGRPRSEDRRLSSHRDRSISAHASGLPQLSQQATIGRNSQFWNLTERDLEVLGGIEYRSLKLLLKIISSYFFGVHLFGAICLVPWIHGQAGSKYTAWLDENGQNWTWWGFYSAQTMVNNLGFTLTPDSMITFRDATWPLVVMTFLAFAGETLYPVFLRLIIWIMSKIAKKGSATREHLQFLLDHPRRCYTLLFPSRPTWILFGIIFTMNFIDVLLIIVLDLYNDAVTDLPIGPRILSAIFQAASARHTGTATLNIANVNPAVQFSLVCMMYIAIFPIAISIRASNTYEDRALGNYGLQENLNEAMGSQYIMAHIRNQLSFDLWYIFLGTFLICISESKRIMDLDEPAFSVFPVFFEVVGNVGLSLGHPMVSTSLSGQFTIFGKFVICAMMIRGRHRGLPNSLDRAIMLPHEFEDQAPALLESGYTDAGASKAKPE